MTQPHTHKPLGFWACWSLTVGSMIGSGIFLLPTTLAPYGLLSLGGWIIAGLGTLTLGLIFGRLATRTRRTGGPYVYAQESFGEFIGFSMAWNYWISFWMGVPVVAIAFVGYVGVFVPVLNTSPVAQALTALGLIWIFTLINVRGLKEMSAVQIAMTFLKIVPLLAIIGLAAAVGTPTNLPEFNPSNAPILPTLAAVTIIALWPFTGFEIVTLPAGAIDNPERTIPRALVSGMITVTIIYLAAALAVMLLVPASMLMQSTAPFADAARAFGPWGAPFIAAGAIIATAGTINGLIFTTGQMPMAVAIDKLAPTWLAATNKGGSPHLALILSSVLASILLLLNYSRGMMDAFAFLLKMSTSLGLIYYFVCSLAELKHDVRSPSGWTGVAVIGMAYSVFAAFGSGLEVLGWGLLLTVLAAPAYLLFRALYRTPTPTIPS